MKRSCSSNSDSVEFLTLLSTQIFDFHYHKRSYDSDYLTSSLVQTSLRFLTCSNQSLNVSCDTLAGREINILVIPLTIVSKRL